MTKSRQALDGKIINIHRGLAVYKIKASPYYYCRIWLPAQKKRLVKTTKATTRAEAISIAEEQFSAMGSRGKLAATPTDRTFEHFADQLVLLEQARGKAGKISDRQWANTRNLLQNPQWGAVKYLGTKDVREIQTHDYLNYMSWVRTKAPSLSTGTLNHIAVRFRKVLSVAQSNGIIDAVPATPREKREDNPREFFQFFPLVEKKNDEYELLKNTAKRMASEGVKIRGIPVTEELYDFILFMVHSFMRPTESEIYALRHSDISVRTNPKRLDITIRKGKTGHRASTTMEAAVSVYNRIKQRNPEYRKDDFLFLPAYKNRSHAKNIIQRQFNALLERCDLKENLRSKSVRTVYSLRHTAICMRLVLSEGKVNIFNLAKNAGTSVDQIERFYARNLPQSAAMARNLQSFGGN